MNVIHKDGKNGIYNLPVYGAGSDIKRGSFLKKGTTPGTDNGMLIAANGASATPDIVGMLQALHDYSVDGDTLIAGTKFVTHPVLLAHPWRIFRMEYDLTAGNAIVCTGAVTTTTMALTTLEGDIDAAFVYVVDGTGEGQTNYATAAGTNDITLKAAFGTSLSTDSYFIKILPRFHILGSFSSDGTKIASQAAAGAVKIVVIDSYIQRGTRLEQLDPTKHAALTGLTSVKGLKFFADIAIRDSIVYSVD